MTDKTEQDLLAACRDGSREAFEVLFLENRKRVYSVALNFFGGDAEKAGDITQQVFLKFFTGIEKFRGDAGVTTWLYRMTVNACIDEQRKTKRLTFVADFFGFAEPRVKKTQYERLHQTEISAAVREALTHLKPEFRIPLVLKYVEGLSYAEIAAVIGCPDGTVASRLNRAHKMLARRLKHLKDEI